MSPVQLAMRYGSALVQRGGGGVRGLQIYHGWANYLAVLQFLPIQNNQDPLSFQAIRILNRLSYEAVL